MLPKVLAATHQIAPQFVKYLCCGVTAFLVHWSIVNALGLTINPAFDQSLGDELRFWRSAQNNTIAFFLSNAVAYYLNLRFVFEGGRHRKSTEVGLFFLASALGFFPALYSLDLIIRTLSLNTHIANIGFPAVAALGNFFARKFLIFRQ
ncbi:GtrA family protein [Roseibacillus ishigakijimensis]|uniref:GtrA family protein n=1 Tax=Roseibacillus ishigakijimensis TaxID=454146 RepID=A0A934RNE9_9BACT|nr:GtrA family protein [Roseibacillus ishigakijimensis]MBK1834023.1 GtrA family protein [Roseibacillus ishigakijimensis]